MVRKRDVVWIYPLMGLLAIWSSGGCAQLDRTAAGKSPPLARFQYRRILMGVEAQIILYAESEEDARSAAGAAFARMDELETVLSDYRNDSEVNLACAQALTATSANPVTVAISADLAQVVQRAEAFSARSAGAFDITVGRLTKLWRGSRHSGELPDETQLTECLQSTGYQHLQVMRDSGDDSHTLTFNAPAMQLDFGGIGKGFAADEALRVLREEFGIHAALVNIGGDLTVGDAPPHTAGWSVAIRTFDAEATDQTIVIANGAVATSGDLEKYVEIAGTRYSHILHPATGLGLTQRVAVTVLAQDGTTADALASAVCVLGAVRGLALVEQSSGVEVRVVELGVNGADRQVSISSGFDLGH